MKRFVSLLLAALMACSVSCGKAKGDKPGKDNSSSSGQDGSQADQVADDKTNTPTKHVSPKEIVTAQVGIEQEVSFVIPKTPEQNTIKVPLAEFIQEGDVINSFTFIIYSDDRKNIGEFKGGFGIALSSGCPAATSDNWYQSPDMTAPTKGNYGEIKWDVPAEIKDYIAPSGEVLFGYWWGDTEKIRVASIVCNFTRTKEIPCDGSVEQKVGQSVEYAASDNIARVPIADFLPANAVPEVVTYNIKGAGSLGRFTGAFGFSSGRGSYMSPSTAVFTSDASASLTWFIPEEVKNLTAKDGELMLHYWWSEQSSITLESVNVKYSLSGDEYGANLGPVIVEDVEGFRSSQEIVDEIKVGWNLGNTLECYNTGRNGIGAETAWGNPKTTKEMIAAVKDAGFNAIRIPVTWGDHMTDDKIDTAWMDRVQEVVDYAYNNNMYVIINMHHDDYLWFEPTEEEYEGDSQRLKLIWEQISERFRDYGDRLIFEGVNEVRTIGSANEWIGGTADERKVVNKYIQDFVNTVRASGGNNAARSLIVTTYGANAEELSMNDLIVPNDKHIIVSVHYYAPWMFSSGQSVIFGDNEKQELAARFDIMKRKFVDKGIPFIIGEFGCIAAADDEVRAEYYSSYISQARDCGIKCFVWDNGVEKGEESYGIFDRRTLKWNETILNGIVNN